MLVWLTLFGVAVAVALHNLAPMEGVAAAADLSAVGRRRTVLAYALPQALLPALGLIIGAWLLRRLGGQAPWSAITFLTGAAIWDLFQPAQNAAVNLPVEANPFYEGPVAGDGAAPTGRLWGVALLFSLDNLAVGIGLGLAGVGRLAGLIAVLVAALVAALAGLYGPDPAERRTRLPRLGTYLLLAVTALMAVFTVSP